MMLYCQCAWFGIILSMVPLAVLFLFWTWYKCWRCAVLFLAKMQNSMNSEECSKTFPSLMTGAVMLGSKPWISSKESNEDNGKGVMDSSKYLTGFKETDMNRIKGQMGNWLEFVASINAKSSGSKTLTLQDIPLMSLLHL